MFGLFKNNKPDQKEATVIAANNIACDFSELIGSGSIEPNLIYDVSLLPHPKELIERSCKLWISICSDEIQRQSWKLLLPSLAQFQKGVGSTPLGLNATALVGKGLSPLEMANRIASMKQPSPELLAKVRAEEQTLLSWVTEVLGRRANSPLPQN